MKSYSEWHIVDIYTKKELSLRALCIRYHRKTNNQLCLAPALKWQSHPLVVSIIHQIPSLPHSLKPVFIHLFSKYLMSILAVLGTWETDNKTQLLVGEA